MQGQGQVVLSFCTTDGTFDMVFFVLAFQIVDHHKTSHNVTYDQLESTFNFVNKPIKDCFIGGIRCPRGLTSLVGYASRTFLELKST